jgi:hypothetical protein
MRSGRARWMRPTQITCDDTNARVERTIREIREAGAAREDTTREAREQLDSFKQSVEKCPSKTPALTPPVRQARINVPKAARGRRSGGARWRLNGDGDSGNRGPRTRSLHRDRNPNEGAATCSAHEGRAANRQAESGFQCRSAPRFRHCNRPIAGSTCVASASTRRLWTSIGSLMMQSGLGSPVSRSCTARAQGALRLAIHESILAQLLK